MEEEEDSFVVLDGFVVLNGVVWRTKDPKSEAPPRRTQAEEEEGGATGIEEHETPELEVTEPEDDVDPCWMSVSKFRCYWNERWSGHYGSFEDTKRPLEMVHTHRDTLQIFSVKLAATRGSLQLPFDVFGFVAVRDPIDHNRNIIFQRERDECQTLTGKDPYLVLAGPTRAVMFALNPTIIEIDLKVKGTTESQDAYLSFQVAPLKCYSTFVSHLFNRDYTSKLSTLEFTFGQIVFSVEATIFVRVVHGSWPDGLRGLFAAFTTGFTDRSPFLVGNKCSTGTGDERIILLDSGGDELPVAGDGNIKLSRRVVSAEGSGEVTVQVKAFKGDIVAVENKISFRASQAGKSIRLIDISFCKMEVTVVWSLISCYP